MRQDKYISKKQKTDLGPTYFSSHNIYSTSTGGEEPYLPFCKYVIKNREKSPWTP